MPNPFFDQNLYLWPREEAQQLHKALYQGLPEPAAIDLLYRKSVGELPPLDLRQTPDLIWAQALDKLALHGALRKFCELCATQSVIAIKEAALAMMQAETTHPPAGARPLHLVGHEDVVPAVVLSLHERHLRALGDALQRVVPSIFRDSRIRVRRLRAAKQALLSVNPLMEALSEAAEEERQQPMRHQLQQLDHTLQKHKKAVSEILFALDKVRSERSARQPCDDLAEAASGLLAAGADALRHVT
jgi:hypothetical protein